MLSTLLVALVLIHSMDCKPVESVETQVINLPDGGQKIIRVHKFRTAVEGDIGATGKVAQPGNTKNNANCQKGLLDGTVNGLRNTLNKGVVSGASGLIASITNNGQLLGPVGGAVNAVGQGAGDLLHHAVNGVGDALSDALCGIGNMFNAAGTALDNGDIVGGVGAVAEQFAGGVGNILNDVAGNVAGGIQGAVGHVGDFLENLF